MKDEIKEINDLWVQINDNDIKEVLEYYKRDIESYEKMALDGYGISNKEAYQRYKNHKLLLYCITNLQEENEFLKLNNPEMNMEHFRIIKENKRKIDNLREENKRLKEIVENLTTMTVCGDKKQIKNTAQYKLDKANEVISSILYSYDERMYEYCDVNYIEELRELKKELGSDK